MSNIRSHFRLILVDSNEYLIETRFKNKRIGIDENNYIKLYNRGVNIKKNSYKIYWNLIEINQNEFLVQSKFNNCFLQIKNNRISLSTKNINFIRNKTYIDEYSFVFLKIFREKKPINNYLNNIRNEPIDMIIKYIDLTDKNLKRKDIIQIYKDQNNEELKYSLRSILQYIPWIRKIYILMPNEKVLFLKSIDEINEKIIYIKDKDLLGYDSANIHSFTFNLYKMKKFGISQNFIYMEDDFFIGKTLKKNDFFYYDELEKRIVPYILSSYFNLIDKTNLLIKYNNMLQIKDSIHPHSGEGWGFSILSTEKYFIENYKKPIIITRYSHNAIPENIDDISIIFEEIQNYKYINETLFHKERHILTLNQPIYLNLYLLNKRNRRVNNIPYEYIPIESLNKYRLQKDLFVLNTGGNHEPLQRHYNIQRKIMNKRYPFQTIYEIVSKNTNIILNRIKKIFYINLKLFILINIIKIFALNIKNDN